jgi:peptidoglycan/xylan/chitin deacetylase (PgdA/CDA1 family)
MEGRHGFRSTFFFMAGRRAAKGARYSLSSVRPAIRGLLERGWEVGLHINYYGFDDLEEIRRQKAALEAVAGQPVEGVRFHWLRFEPARSFDLLVQAGFRYDSTLGFHDGVGHRTGAAQAYRQPAPDGGLLPIVEIPMNVMDIALLYYMRLSPAAAWDVIRSTLDSFKGTAATLSILWHSNVLTDPVFDGWGALYEKTLQYLADNRFAVKTGKEICDSVMHTAGR